MTSDQPSPWRPELLTALRLLARLSEARLLFRLNPYLDMAYPDRRLREETAGDHGIEDL